jgi:hypothetical protein
VDAVGCHAGAGGEGGAAGHQGGVRRPPAPSNGTTNTRYGG